MTSRTQTEKFPQLTFTPAGAVDELKWVYASQTGNTGWSVGLEIGDRGGCVLYHDQVRDLRNYLSRCLDLMEQGVPEPDRYYGLGKP